MPTVSRWWRSRTDPERIGLYTRWSYYGTLLCLAPVLLLAARPAWSSEATWLAAALVVGALATTGGCLWVARALLITRASTGGAGPTTSQLVVLAATAVPTAVLGVAAVVGGPEPTPSAPWVVGLVGAAVLLTLSVSWPMRRLAWGSVPLAGLAGAASLVDGNTARSAVVVGWSILVALLAFASAFRFTVWMLDVVQDMERSRGVQLQLAVAEERLRFSRDLHDVMGRNLSAIAVKSKLAAELARRGRDGAADEMDGVSALAESSLREVREVVRGYRATDLASELAGARSVLRAAGVVTAVAGEDAVGQVPVPVQELLGWVVREAVTNVLRHSAADRCDIALDTTTERTTLTVRDDGTTGRTGWGNGLTGLAERVGAAGGRVDAAPGPDGFVLVAVVPA